MHHKNDSSNVSLHERCTPLHFVQEFFTRATRPQISKSGLKSSTEKCECFCHGAFASDSYTKFNCLAAWRAATCKKWRAMRVPTLRAVVPLSCCWPAPTFAQWHPRPVRTRQGLETKQGDDSKHMTVSPQQGGGGGQFCVVFHNAPRGRSRQLYAAPGYCAD